MAEKGNPEDECLAKLIRKYKVTIPIIRDREKEKTYFMGTQKYRMEYRYQSIIVKMGVNIERFDSFVPKMQRKIQRQLIEYMSKSQRNLYDVLEMLFRGQKIYTKSSIPKAQSFNVSQTRENQPIFNAIQQQSYLKHVPVKNVQIGSERSESVNSRESRGSLSRKRYSYGSNLNQLGSKPEGGSSSPWKKLHHLKRVSVNLQSDRDDSISRRSSEARNLNLYNFENFAA